MLRLVLAHSAGPFVIILLACLIVAIIFLGSALWLTYGMRLYNVEAMGRTVDAWQVFKDGNWDSVGFSFLLPPLPTVLQWPLVQVPFLRDSGFAGNVISVIAGVAAFWALARILQQLRVPGVLRAVLLASFALNPLVWLSAANGTGEMLFVALILFSLDQGLGLTIRRVPGDQAVDLNEPAIDFPVQRVVLIGFFVGFAALTRFSGFAYIIMWGLVLWYLASRAKTGHEGLQAVGILYVLPPIFVVGLWVLGSAMLTGDPFYPLTHLSEASLRSGISDPLLAREMGTTVRDATALDIALSLLEQIVLVHPLFALTIPVLLIAARQGNRTAGMLAATGLTLPIALLLTLPLRRSPLAMHDLLLLTPMGLIYAGWIAVQLLQPARKRTSERLRQSPVALRRSSSLAPSLVLAAALVLAIGGPLAATLGMLRADEPGQWSREFVLSLPGIFVPGLARPTEVWKIQEEIAATATAGVGRSSVLLDDLIGYRLIFLSGKPELFLTRANKDFNTVVQAPAGKVSYVLVPAPSPSSAVDAVGRANPGIYANGAPWATQAANWPTAGWRLYRAGGPAPVPQVGR